MNDAIKDHVNAVEKRVLSFSLNRFKAPELKLFRRKFTSRIDRLYAF
jgi:hypothetical protein